MKIGNQRRSPSFRSGCQGSAIPLSVSRMKASWNDLHVPATVALTHYKEEHPPMTDFLDDKRSEIGNRMKELQPLVDEYHRLEAATAALDGVASAPVNGNASPPARERATRSTPNPRKAVRPGRGRPKGSGTRGAEALALVKESPGITIPEIAEKMGIKQNYLYRLLPDLAKSGEVVKDGRGWHAKEPAAPPPVAPAA